MRNGTGNPPLCRAHALVLQEQYAAAADPGGGRLGKVVGDFMAGRKIRPEDAVGAFRDLFGAMGIGVPRPPAWGPSGPGVPPPGTRGIPRPPPAPPPGVDPELAERRRRIAMARQELGFEARGALTRDAIERRRKELARKHHPDLGGDPARMSRINQAADLLVECGAVG